MMIGKLHSSSCVLNESGAVLPLTRLLRGNEPSASCWRLNRKFTTSRAVRVSPASRSPVQASYTSRAKTSRYDPKYVLLGSPAETAWPQGEAMLAISAPGKVLSSEALT